MNCSRWEWMAHSNPLLAKPDCFRRNYQHSFDCKQARRADCWGLFSPVKTIQVSVHILKDNLRYRLLPFNPAVTQLPSMTFRIYPSSPLSDASQQNCSNDPHRVPAVLLAGAAIVPFSTLMSQGSREEQSLLTGTFH